MTFGKKLFLNNGLKVAEEGGQIKFQIFQVKITLGHDLCLFIDVW
jgi:hypothetical protein